MPGPLRRDRTALVLAGGAARGAYEVGVVEHIIRKVADDIGREVRFDILSGTSVGALNACGLAAYADLGRDRIDKLIEVWTGLDVMTLVRPDVATVLEIGARVIGRGSREIPVDRAGGVLDPTALESLVETSIPFDRIEANVQAGLLRALTVSTTHVRSGRTVVFVHGKEAELPKWAHDKTTMARAAKITARHALASAAIPILFRPIALDGRFYSDGGLRQNVPLSPARRLGAGRVLVVNPRYLSQVDLDEPAEHEERPGPFFLFGKALNALLLDRIDTDLSRLETINRILDAGTRAFGPGFVEAMNGELGYATGEGFAPMQAMLVRASSDIGALAADFVRSPAFARIGGITGRLMRRLADPESRDESDLLSYLLFDGEFARLLIELGRSDAAKMHDSLCAFFADQ